MLVNGEEAALGGSCTLRAFLEEKGFDTGRVAVERNGEIVPAAGFDAEILDDGDRLEIVAFIGGG